MARRKILMGCVNYWTSPFQVGSHHYARQFVEAGFDVGFISEPISPFHLAKGMSHDLRERLKLYLANGKHYHDGRLWAYVPGALLAPGHRWPMRTRRLQRSWWKLTMPNVVRTTAEQGFDEVDLLYLDSVKHHFWRKRIKARRVVYRMADYNPGFERFSPALHDLERRLIRKADVVVYSSQTLAEYVASLGPKKMVHIPNGVDFQHFQEGPADVPLEYQRLPKPIVVYVGSLDVWFDYGLLTYTARRLPNVSFVLIGPEEMARTRLALPNVHFLGRKPYHALPGYLHHADAGIIPFDVAGHARLIHSVNPLKLYEYLSCGLPVVATEWDELRRLSSPARLCRTREQFVAALTDVLRTPPPKATLRQYAATMDWANSAKALLDLIDVEC